MMRYLLQFLLVIACSANSLARSQHDLSPSVADDRREVLVGASGSVTVLPLHEKVPAQFSEVDASAAQIEQEIMRASDENVAMEDPVATETSGNKKEQGEGDVRITASTVLHISKAIGVILVFAAAIVGIILRFEFPSLGTPTMLSYINVLTGSMFIGMALFLILPDALERAPKEITTLLTPKPSGIVVAGLVFFGFLIILYMERVLFEVEGVLHEEDEEIEQSLKQTMNAKNGFMSRAITRDFNNEAVKRDNLKKVSRKPDVLMPKAPADGGGARGSQDLDADSHTRPIILMIALSITALFEGMIIGTAENPGTVYLFVFIVVTHKWAAAFALTNQLTPEQLATKVAYGILAIFSLASPVGYLIGWAVSSNSDSVGMMMVVTVMNSMAAGTLLYLGMVEVIPEEFTGTSRALKKFAVLCAGAGLVFFLALLNIRYRQEDEAQKA